MFSHWKNIFKKIFVTYKYKYNSFVTLFIKKLWLITEIGTHFTSLNTTHNDTTNFYLNFISNMIFSNLQNSFIDNVAHLYYICNDVCLKLIILNVFFQLPTNWRITLFESIWVFLKIFADLKKKNLKRYIIDLIVCT